MSKNLSVIIITNRKYDIIIIIFVLFENRLSIIFLLIIINW